MSNRMKDRLRIYNTRYIFKFLLSCTIIAPLLTMVALAQRTGQFRENFQILHIAYIDNCIPRIHTITYTNLQHSCNLVKKTCRTLSHDRNLRCIQYFKTMWRAFLRLYKSTQAYNEYIVLNEYTKITWTQVVDY